MVQRFIAAAALSALLAWMPTAAAQSSTYSGLLVFGDSISDSGNRAADVGVNAGQRISGNSYYPSKPYATRNYSNGPVWAQDLAQSLGLSPLTPSAKGGGNFAYAFASVLQPGSSAPYSLPTQLSSYLGRTGGVADPNALYVLAGGANDVFDLWDAAADSALAQTANASFASTMGAMVDRLQAAGARHIVVWNVPNLGLTPGMRSVGSSFASNASALASGMNAALSQRLAQEGADVQLFDVYGLWTQWAAAPSPRFVNVVDACGAPSRHCDAATALFWDAVHPTAAAHEAMAAALHAQVSQVPEPGALLLMLAGVGLLASRQRRCRE